MAMSSVFTATKLFISNLDYRVTDVDIGMLFSDFKSITEATVHYSQWGYSLGTAHVVFMNSEDAFMAEKEFQGVYLEGRPMAITCIGDPARSQYFHGRLPVKMRLSSATNKPLKVVKRLSDNWRSGRPNAQVMKDDIIKLLSNPVKESLTRFRRRASDSNSSSVSTSVSNTIGDLDVQLDEYNAERKTLNNEPNKEQEEEEAAYWNATINDTLESLVLTENILLGESLASSIEEMDTGDTTIGKDGESALSSSKLNRKCENSSAASKVEVEQNEEFLQDENSKSPDTEVFKLYLDELDEVPTQGKNEEQKINAETSVPNDLVEKTVGRKLLSNIDLVISNDEEIVTMTATEENPRMEIPDMKTVANDEYQEKNLSETEKFSQSEKILDSVLNQETDTLTSDVISYEIESVILKSNELQDEIESVIVKSDGPEDEIESLGEVEQNTLDETEVAFTSYDQDNIHVVAGQSDPTSDFAEQVPETLETVPDPDKELPAAAAVIASEPAEIFSDTEISDEKTIKPGKGERKTGKASVLEKKEKTNPDSVLKTKKISVRLSKLKEDPSADQINEEETASETVDKKAPKLKRENHPRRSTRSTPRKLQK